MTHYQALMHELARSGGRTTYAELAARYTDAQGYSHEGFTSAVYVARKRGIVAKTKRGGGPGGPIVAVSVCPCCGREL